MSGSTPDTGFKRGISQTFSPTEVPDKDHVGAPPASRRKESTSPGPQAKIQKMSKHVGYYYGSNTITKHSDSYFKEHEEELDYVNNTRRYRIRTALRNNEQTGSNWQTGIGFFPKTKPALPEGNTSNCTTVAEEAKDSSNALGLKYGSRDVKEKRGGNDSDSDEEETDCPPNPERPGLRYKRTRKRVHVYKEGDRVTQSSFRFGFSTNW